MGRRQEAMEVGREAREVPFAGEEPRLGLEKRRASGHGGLAGLPVRVASFPHFRPLNNVSQSVTQEPRVVQDHLLWWPKSDGKEASLSIPTLHIIWMWQERQWARGGDGVGGMGGQ